MNVKKIIAGLLITLLLPFNAFCAQNVKCGEALNSNIVAYINNYSIPSYSVNGTTVIVAEDLKNYGFDIQWDEATRTIGITRSPWNTIVGMKFYENIEPSGSKFCDLYRSDVAVYVGNTRLTSYSMNGYTMIPIEELTMFGQVCWVEELRAIKLWIDGMNVSNYLVKPSPYPTTVLYAKNGSTIRVYQGKENEYLSLGYYRTQAEAHSAGMADKNKSSIGKFKIGDKVQKTYLVFEKYGTVIDIDRASGKVKVSWSKAIDSKGKTQTGLGGILYGVGSDTWEDAATLILR